MNEDTISRAAAIAKVEPDEYYHSNEVKAMLEGLPTVPPQVVYGRWIFKNDGPYGRTRAYCSVCGKRSGIGGIRSNQAKPYCPNCGHPMDGGGDDAAD